MYILSIFSVYVFLGQLNAMVDMATNLNDRGLLLTGDYVIIFIDQRSRTVYHDPLKYFKRQYFLLSKSL